MTRSYNLSPEGYARKRSREVSEAIKAALSDPKVRDKMRAKRVGPLAALTPAQRLIYNKLKANKFSRQDALKEAVKGVR